MDESRLHRLVRLAQEDMFDHNLRRAKERLRAVLRDSPNHQSALELLGFVCYAYGDYRNAVMHWSRADYWQNPAPHACLKVFRSTAKALAKENPRAARYNLYAFAGTNPPDDLKENLTSLQNAYYRYNIKKSKLSGLACAPLCGACMIAMLGLISVLLGVGWSWFAWMGALAVISTGIVIAINTWSYLRASRVFRESLAPFRPQPT